MPISESVAVALFIIMVVFFLLACLYGLIFLSTRMILRFTGAPMPADKLPASTPALPEDTQVAHFASGTLRLHQVDEETAALLMAIVSDTSGIPLSELQFKSIRRLEKNRPATKEAVL